MRLNVEICRHGQLIESSSSQLDEPPYVTQLTRTAVLTTVSFTCRKHFVDPLITANYLIICDLLLIEL